MISQASWRVTTVPRGIGLATGHRHSTGLFRSIRFFKGVLRMLTIIVSALMILWFCLPLLAFAANAGRREPLHPFLLFTITVFVGFALLAASAWTSDIHLKAEMERFDVDGDGGFGGSELTAEAQQAINAWASDTGRTMVVVTGIPLSVIWAGICFAVLHSGTWIIGKTISARSAAMHPCVPHMTPRRSDATE